MQLPRTITSFSTRCAARGEKRFLKEIDGSTNARREANTRAAQQGAYNAIRVRESQVLSSGIYGATIIPVFMPMIPQLERRLGLWLRGNSSRGSRGSNVVTCARSRFPSLPPWLPLSSTRSAQLSCLTGSYLDTSVDFSASFARPACGR